MEQFSEHRIDRHVKYPHREQNDMNNQLGGIRDLTRVAVIGIALVLTSAQGVAADSLRPTIDTGGSGGGASSAEMYYELEYEQGRPVVVEQVDSESASQAAVEAAGREAQAWPNYDSTSIVVQQPNVSALEGGPYAIGNASVPEQAAVEAAGREARTWPNYDSTSIVVQQPNTSAQEDEFYAIAHEHGNGTFAEQPNASASAGGSYVIVDDLGNASAPEQMTGQTASSAEAPAFAAHPNLRSIQLIEGKVAVAEVARPASASAYSVCLACSTLG